MEFTYKAYVELLNLMKRKKYKFCNYFDCDNYKKAVILRHDIDMSINKALKIAEIENNLGIKSTFFTLLSTNFYNIFSKESNAILRRILAFGHDIGLHFDEKNYPISDYKDLEFFVNKECKILGLALDVEVNSVSMHRPSKWIIENDIKFKKIINAYSKQFFSDFKYLSDSRMHWRENILNVIENEIYNKLHILTHPFWYSNEIETMDYKIEKFINDAKQDRYESLKLNSNNLEEIIRGGA